MPVRIGSEPNILLGEEPATSLIGTEVYSCASGLVMFSPIYASSLANTVDVAAANDPTKMPVRGFVIAKPGPTSCNIQRDGELSGLSGLTEDATYYASYSGAAGAVAIGGGWISATAPTTPGQMVQKIGFAKTANVLVISLDDTVRL